MLGHHIGCSDDTFFICWPIVTLKVHEHFGQCLAYQCTNFSSRDFYVLSMWNSRKKHSDGRLIKQVSLSLQEIKEKRERLHFAEGEVVCGLITEWSSGVHLFFLFRHHYRIEFKGFKLPSCVVLYFLLGCPLFFTEANVVTGT